MGDEPVADNTDLEGPPVPPLNHYLRVSGYLGMTQTKDFQDHNLSGAAAGFVTYMPVTMLFRRWPFRIFAFILAACYGCFAALFAFEVIEVPVRTREVDIRFLLALAYALTSCIVAAAPFFAMRGHPRRATRLGGIALSLHALMIAMIMFPLLAFDSMGAIWQPSVWDVCVNVAMELTSAVPLLCMESWWLPVFLLVSFCYLVYALFVAAQTRYMVAALLFIPTILGLCLIVLSVGWRQWSLRKAMQEAKQDCLCYDKVWDEVKGLHEEQLRLLAELARSVPQRRVSQPFPSLEITYKRAYSLNDWYQAVVQRWASACGVTAQPAPVKSPLRAREKANRSYGGDFHKVCDILRSTIVVQDIGHVAKVLTHVLQLVRMHQVKNRFDPKFDAAKTAGYRDLNCQLSMKELDGTGFAGFVFELQIHYAPILAVKSMEGHRRYITLRNLRGD